MIAGTSDSCCRKKSACCSKPDRSNNGIDAPEEDEAWPIVGVAIESVEAAAAIGIGVAHLCAASQLRTGASLMVTFGLFDSGAHCLIANRRIRGELLQ